MLGNWKKVCSFPHARSVASTSILHENFCFPRMSSEREKSEIVVDEVVPLETGQSKYVRPLRMHFSQVRKLLLNNRF